MTSKKYKALLCGVDGTLIPNRMDGVPSPKVIEAVNKASEILHVGVATSRPLFLLKNIFKTLELTGPSIIIGGGQIVDAQHHTILWEKTMNHQTLMKICGELKEMNIAFFVSDNGVDAKDFDSYKPVKPHMIVIMNLFPEVGEKIVATFSRYPDISIHKVPDWNKGKISVTMTHAEATKQHGIFEVAKILGIETKEIIGVGDGYNDFPLLMACGLKVAMGNAVPDIKAIADYIAPTVEEDGVAHLIEKFILTS